MSLVLGFDLSLTSSGLAAIYNGELVSVETVKSKGKKGDTYVEYLARFNKIVGEIKSWAGREMYRRSLRDILAVVEAPSFGSKFGNPHERAGLWWEVVTMLDHIGIEVVQVAPATRAKYITGDGRAKKPVVLAHAIERYVVPGGPSIGNDDEADAVGLADMGARWFGDSPVHDGLMPERNLQSMGVVRWPTPLAS